MRKFIVAGLALAAIGGVAGGVAVAEADGPPPGGPLPDGVLVLNALAGDAGPPLPRFAVAQNDPPPAPGGHGPAVPPPPQPQPPGMDGGRGWMRNGAGRPMWRRIAMFGLFFHPADKQLTPADVQKIAEAFLLWQGNRDWKVTQVAAGADGQIGFAFATADGGVIARFTMDSRTGRLARVG